MSDFTFTASCPGCHQRMALDDGGCCSWCESCEDWHDRRTEVELCERCGRLHCTRSWCPCLDEDEEE